MLKARPPLAVMAGLNKRFKKRARKKQPGKYAASGLFIFGKNSYSVKALSNDFLSCNLIFFCTRKVKTIKSRAGTNNTCKGKSAAV
jgi:hypothetical protein